jgi:hypothetical protein
MFLIFYKREIKMGLQKFFRNLEKNGLISRKPRPIYLFLLALTYYLYWFILDMHQPSQLRFFENLMLYATIFTIFFAFLHWMIVYILTAE